MNEDVFFLAGIVLLSIALYFPVNKMIWVLSVRRLERKYKKILKSLYPSIHQGFFDEFLNIIIEK